MSESQKFEIPKLPPPNFDGAGGAAMKALANRRTIRAISARPLSAEALSNLLWAAWGVNRSEGAFGQPGRTAASASNSQEIDLYALTQAGAFVYDGRAHRLTPIAAGDLRAEALTPGQRGVNSEAPLHLVYVADVERLIHTRGFPEPGLRDPETQKAYFYVDAGLIAANVYHFAAAAGLAAWFHNCDRSALARDLGLRPEQRVLFAQSVGYPSETA